MGEQAAHLSPCHLQDLLRTAVDVEEQKLRAVEKLEEKLKLAPMTHHQREVL